MSFALRQAKNFEAMVRKAQELMAKAKPETLYGKAICVNQQKVKQRQRRRRRNRMARHARRRNRLYA